MLKLFRSPLVNLVIVALFLSVIQVTPLGAYSQNQKEETPKEFISDEEMENLVDSGQAEILSPGEENSVSQEGHKAKSVTQEKIRKSDIEIAYVGSRNSNKYHYPSCVWARKIKLQNLVTFGNKQETDARGYIPCKVCKP